MTSYRRALTDEVLYENGNMVCDELEWDVLWLCGPAR